MRAWRLNELGPPSRSLLLEEVPEPEAGPGEVVIRVEGAVVNFADILVCEGRYQDRTAVPLTPGLECCGTIEAVGANVDLQPGARIGGMTELRAGAFAEKAVIRSATAVELSADYPAADAAVLYATFLTAHMGLHRRAGLQDGETLVVLGAASGVGSAAVQLGRAGGARVVAVAGGKKKAEHCAHLGATVVVDHRVDDLAEAVATVTGGRGADVVFDPVGGPLGDLARRLLAWEGRLVVAGFASGEISSIPANHLLLKNYSVLGLHMGIYGERGHRAAMLDAHDAVIGLYERGLVHTDISRVIGLQDVPEAMAALDRREVLGRIVMVPRGAT